MCVTKTPPETGETTNKSVGNEPQECPEADITPRLNPSKGANPENDLYEIWKASDTSARPQVEAYLLPHLRRHAAKVCWMVLHSHQPHLIDEISQDVLMELGDFEERSSFSTWFHSRALHRCYKERRDTRRRREISLESPAGRKSIGSSSGFENSIAMQQMVSRLDQEEQFLIKLKVQQGMTDEEAAVELKISRQYVQYLWNGLRKKLRMLYNERHIAE